MLIKSLVTVYKSFVEIWHTIRILEEKNVKMANVLVTSISLFKANLELFGSLVQGVGPSLTYNVLISLFTNHSSWQKSKKHSLFRLVLQCYWPNLRMIGAWLDPKVPIKIVTFWRYHRVISTNVFIFALLVVLEGWSGVRQNCSDGSQDRS